MAQKRKSGILNFVLLLVWLTLMVLEITTPARSQGCLPPLVTPGYMNPINTTWNSWRPAIGDVTVKIDSSFTSITANLATSALVRGLKQRLSKFDRTLYSVIQFISIISGLMKSATLLI